MTKTISGAPSDFLEVIHVHNDSVAAAADLQLTTRIETGLYEYFLIVASMGDGDTALAIIPEEVDAATGGTPVAISGKTINFGVTDDQKGAEVEIRCHGLASHLDINVTGTGGTASDLALTVFGIIRQYTAEFPAFSTTPAAVTGIS